MHSMVRLWLDCCKSIYIKYHIQELEQSYYICTHTVTEVVKTCEPNQINPKRKIWSILQCSKSANSCPRIRGYNRNYITSQVSATILEYLNACTSTHLKLHTSLYYKIPINSYSCVRAFSPVHAFEGITEIWLWPKYLQAKQGVEGHNRWQLGDTDINSILTDIGARWVQATGSRVWSTFDSSSVLYIHMQ